MRSAFGYVCIGHAGGGGLGGAVVGDSTVKIINSTITANVAQGGRGAPVLTCPAAICIGGDGGVASGGAIVARSTETVINSTIAGNQAIGGLGGSGRNGSGKQGTDSAGGIDLSGGSVDLTNAILASNNAHTGPDCDGTVTSGGHNLLGNDSSCSGFTNTGDLVNVDPLLGLLQNNGGPTQTMALLDGSPAIDAADDIVCAAPPVTGKDQRGVARPQGPHCDIGAFEVQTS